MAAGPMRDDIVLVDGVNRWLASRGKSVTRMRRPSSGWTNETVMFDVREPAETLVVRLPALVPSFPDQDIDVEAAVPRTLARGAAVPTPGLIAVEHDDSWLGAPFVVMSFVAGNVVGDVPAFDEWLTALPVKQQRALHETYIAALASVHTFDWRAASFDSTLRAGLGEE